MISSVKCSGEVQDDIRQSVHLAIPGAGASSVTWREQKALERLELGGGGVRWRPLCVYTFRSDAGPAAGVGRSEQAELIAVNTKAAGFGGEGEESMSGFTGWDHLLNRDTRGGVDGCRGSAVRSSFCVCEVLSCAGGIK